MIEKEDGRFGFADRATPASPGAPSGLRHSGSIASASHTPGPWVAGWGSGLCGPTTRSHHPFCGGLDWESYPVSRGEETIALVPACANGGVGNCRQDRDQMLANARLIAAAPDMLEALQIIAANPNNLTHRQPFLGIVEAAIAKATAQGIEARSDETAQQAQPEGREPGAEGMRP